MFTSLRSRLWLSYALVITIALGVVAVVLLLFLVRNPLLSRQTQERLRVVQNLISSNPQAFINDSGSLDRIVQEYEVRILVFNSGRELLLDTDPGGPGLPFPRRNLLGRTSQVALDENGDGWLYAASRLAGGRVLVVAARRPRVPVLNIFTDELLVPILQGGLIALLLSLVLAFALSRWVADPLQRIIAAARGYPDQTREGVAIPPRGPREVQDLTRAFNSMVRRVDRAQQSQKDFVANVSHELKTPLTSIQGFAQAMLEDAVDTPEARRQAAQIIYDEAARMHRLALDLLELARLEAGTADLNMSAVDVGVLLRAVVDKSGPQASQAGVALELDLPAELPPAYGDGDRLSQVFTNLVDNALKFTPAGGQIILWAKGAGREIEFQVTDTGEGVPEASLPRLFDRFYQVDPSRAGGERHGSGLGLAIVREIVQAHGGRISVRSRSGEGTTFVVHLPVAIE